MYVYYEQYMYNTSNRNWYGRYIYTHQITVHENQSHKQYEELKAKHCHGKVSYSKYARRVYIRVLARRTKVTKAHKSHAFYNKVECAHWAEVRNYILGINYRIDYDESGNKTVSRVLD